MFFKNKKQNVTAGEEHSKVFVICEFIYVDGYFVCSYVCLPSVCSALWGQKGAWNPLEWELRMAVSHYVGIETGSSKRAVSVLHYSATLV